jgi:ribosomal protein S18 acetylase RimI-like enzyme
MPRGDQDQREAVTEADIGALRRAAEQPVEAGAADRGAVARDLALAFSDYPMFRWFMRTDARREPALHSFFRTLTAGALAEGNLILRPSTGGAASVWVASETIREAAFWENLRGLPMMLQATGLARFPRIASLRKAMDLHHPMARPHAYLWLLGVTPAAQGKGVGSRLLSAGLARVDAQRRPAFLETSTEANVALYRRHGFEVIDEYWVRPDSPPSWAMWREPQAGD